MTLSCFPANSRLARLAVLLAAYLAAAIVGRAQSPPSPTASPSPESKTRKPTAYVRFWNMLPRDNAKGGGKLELFAGATNGPEARPIFASRPMNTSVGYLPVPPGNYTFRICRPEDREHPIKVVPVVLRDHVFITLLTHLVDGQPQSEMIDDTIDPAKTSGGQLTVRHFLADARAVVTADNKARTGPLNYGDTQVLTGLPARLVPISLEAVLHGNDQWTSTAEADFSPGPTHSPHASLLLLSDAYGRLAVSVVEDGVAPEPEPEPSPAKTPSSGQR